VKKCDGCQKQKINLLQIGKELFICADCAQKLVKIYDKEVSYECVKD